MLYKQSLQTLFLLYTCLTIVTTSQASVISNETNLFSIFGLLHLCSWITLQTATYFSLDTSLNFVIQDARKQEVIQIEVTPYFIRAYCNELTLGMCGMKYQLLKHFIHSLGLNQ